MKKSKTASPAVSAAPLAPAQSPLADDSDDAVFVQQNRTQPGFEGPIPEEGYVELPPSPGP